MCTGIYLFLVVDKRLGNVIHKIYKVIGFLKEIVVPYWQAGKTLIDDH